MREKGTIVIIFWIISVISKKGSSENTKLLQSIWYSPLNQYCSLDSAQQHLHLHKHEYMNDSDLLELECVKGSYYWPVVKTKRNKFKTLQHVTEKQRSVPPPPPPPTSKHIPIASGEKSSEGSDFGHNHNFWIYIFQHNSLCLLLIVIGSLLSLCSYLYMTITRTARMVNKIPGNGPILPFIGTGHMFIGPPTAVGTTISKFTKTYGSIFRFWKMHYPYVVLVSAADIQKLLSSTEHIDKGQDYHQLHWMNGDGLITSGGETWRKDRKLLNPSFKFQRYERFLDCFNKNGNVLVKILKETFPTGSEVVDLHPQICRCTMDTVLEGVLGKESNIQLDKDLNHADSLYYAGKIVLKSYRLRAFNPWLAWPIIRNLFGIHKEEQQSKKLFTDTMIQVIEERRNAMQTGQVLDAENAPFIDSLLDSRSNQNLVDHAFTIFAAGFETNATTMNFTLFLLALNPQHQALVHQEIDQVFFREGKTRDPTFTDLAELKYLDMCILETMRMYPPAPMFTRSIKSDLTLDSGVIIPKGCDAVIFVPELHNEPNVFPNPMLFNPERFLPENCTARHNYAYIPFSKGLRSCIGQKYATIQMKTVLCQILREFSVSTQMKREDVLMIYGTVIEIDKELYMTLTPRS